MGERAVAVVANSETAVYRSQWAGSDRTVQTVLTAPHRTALDVLCTHEWRLDRHRSSGAGPARSVATTLDCLALDAVYHLTPSSLSVWTPLWFGFPHVEPGADATLGALVRVETGAEYRRLRERFRWLKGILQDALVCGAVSTGQARILLGLVLDSRDVVLGRALGTWADTYMR